MLLRKNDKEGDELLGKKHEKKIAELEKQVEALFKINSELREQLEKEAVRRVELVKENQILRKDLAKANQTIENLKTRIKKNSSNSSKPSSTDSIYTKEVHNFREKTSRKVGGQKGHKGHTLRMSKEPTKIINKKIEQCECGGIVENGDTYKAKQLMDIRIEVDITEERVYDGKCNNCGKYHTGEFSEKLKNPVQYGENIKSLTTLLVDEGYIALNRCAKLIKDITNNKITVTEGTIINFRKELANNSSEIIEAIRQNLIEAELLHVDDTGVRVTGGLGWLHTFTTNKFTLYQIYKGRKPDTIDDMEILSYFVGILIHDHFKGYYSYKTMTHAECNVHILRYLKLVIECFERKGAERLLDFLAIINDEKKIAIQYGFESFSDNRIEEIEKQYIQILDDWQEEFSEYIKGKSLTKGLTDERNLFSRLLEYKDEHLLFIKDFRVPFDNNMAERSLRMIKTKLKVSGCFRGADKGSNFATIRSVIETAKKHKMNLHDTLVKIFNKEKIEFVEV